MWAPIRAGVSKYVCSCELHRSSADMQASGMFRGIKQQCCSLCENLNFLYCKAVGGKTGLGGCIFVKRQPTFLKSRDNEKIGESNGLSCDPNDTNNFKQKA